MRTVQGNLKHVKRLTLSMVETSVKGDSLEKTEKRSL